jgi:pyruvate formate lyase activating enzyme
MDTSPVYAWLRNPSMVDYPGHLAAVFFTAGCNFACGFCHNAELMGTPREGATWEKLDAACKRFTDDWVTAAVITGGEPTLSAQLPALIRHLKQRGWRIKLDTNGSNPDMLAACLPLLDYVAMDIKTDFIGYPALTGYGDTAALHRSIGLIKDQARDYEFRTTLIAGEHDADTLAAMVPLIEGAKRYVLQPFIPADILPGARFRTLPRTTVGTLQAARAIFDGHVEELIVRNA